MSVEDSVQNRCDSHKSKVAVLKEHTRIIHTTKHCVLKFQREKGSSMKILHSTITRNGVASATVSAKERLPTEDTRNTCRTIM